VQLPVTLVLKQSRALAAALTAAHILAAAGLVPTTLPAPAKLIAGLFIALSLVRCLRRRPAVSLRLKTDGTLEIERPDGARQEACVLPGTTVFPWLVVLSLRVGGRKESLTLPMDALGVDGQRQLRLWLRWKAGSTAGPSQGGTA
jgi:toxin CptA